MKATSPFIVCWTTFGGAAWASSSQPWTRSARGSCSRTAAPATSAVARSSSSRRETPVIASPARDDLPRRIVGRIVLGQHIVRPVALLPLWYGRLALGLGHEARPFDQLVLVDIARTVGKDLGRVHAHDQLRFGVLGEQRVGFVDRGDAVQA